MLGRNLNFILAVAGATIFATALAVSNAVIQRAERQPYSDYAYQPARDRARLVGGGASKRPRVPTNPTAKIRKIGRTLNSALNGPRFRRMARAIGYRACRSSSPGWNLQG
jgi:hypothetical protein